MQRLDRTTFKTSRLLDFCSEKELTAQIGHDRNDWALVILKETVDNALDACEESGVAPEIMITVDSSGITVADNGPGIPASTIEGALDYSVRVSNREAYVAPDRGAQGNALKTLVAMPFVLDGKCGHVEVTARGVRHRIDFSVDPIRQKPVISHGSTPAENVKNGTSLTIHWPVSACSLLEDSKDHFLQLAAAYSCLNPHLTLEVEWFGAVSYRSEATCQDWKKWRPNEPTSAHWYELNHFERLTAAYIAHDQDRGAERSVRELVKEFRGLTGSAKQKKVLDATGLARTNLSALANGDGLQHDVVENLLAAMQENSSPVKPMALGAIGKDHIAHRFASLGCVEDSFQYRKVMWTGEVGLPSIVEVAFGWRGEEDAGDYSNFENRRIITGVNWSPGIINPFRRLTSDSMYEVGLSSILEDLEAGPEEPIVFFLHYVNPRVQYTDRGKSAVVLNSESSDKIVKAVKAVTSKWTKQRKAEERGRSKVSRRDAVARKPSNMTQVEAARIVMPRAYMKASGNGTLPASVRQIMYAARGAILRLSSTSHLSASYFSQTLLPNYLAENPTTTKGWDVVYDARGRFAEPHTGLTVPLGTIDVRRYLKDAQAHQNRELDVDAIFPDRLLRYPTHGPENRFNAILFIEKEGFEPLFRAARLAECYDLAIMSTKGMPVVACRRLADVLCGQHGIPLFVLHDFDKAGFSILGTLQDVEKETRKRYEFQHDIDVIDLGIRWQDIEDHGLESERVSYKADPSNNLRQNGATDEEIEFLCGGSRDRQQGQRVELNAFTSDVFIEWIEANLKEHGVEKVAPDAETLERTYRRATQMAIVRGQLDEIVEEAGEQAKEASLPKGLEGMIRRCLEKEPTRSWDEVVTELAGEALVAG